MKTLYEISLEKYINLYEENNSSLLNITGPEYDVLSSFDIDETYGRMMTAAILSNYAYSLEGSSITELLRRFKIKEGDFLVANSEIMETSAFIGVTTSGDCLI